MFVLFGLAGKVHSSGLVLLDCWNLVIDHNFFGEIIYPLHFGFSSVVQSIDIDIVSSFGFHIDQYNSIILVCSCLKVFYKSCPVYNSLCDGFLLQTHTLISQITFGRVIIIHWI